MSGGTNMGDVTKIGMGETRRTNLLPNSRINMGAYPPSLGVALSGYRYARGIQNFAPVAPTWWTFQIQKLGMKTTISVALAQPWGGTLGRV